MANDFRILRRTLLAIQVCSSLSPDETAVRLNAEEPTGIDSPWSLADKEACKGAPNPVVCAECPTTHRHYVFTC